MVRPPSGDIDVLVIFVVHEFNVIHILIHHRTEKTRKKVDATSLELDKKKRNALLGLHAISGNDCVSGLFRQGKVGFWRMMMKKAEFLDAFGEFRTSIMAS